MRTAPRNQSTHTSFDSFGELLGRALFIGVGLLILTQYGFRDVFTSMLGLTFTLGPIVTVEAVKVRIESLLKITSNRVSQKVIGKEVFTVEQSDFQGPNGNRPLARRSHSTRTREAGGARRASGTGRRLEPCSRFRFARRRHCKRVPAVDGKGRPSQRLCQC